MKMFDVLANAPHLFLAQSYQQQFKFLQRITRELLSRVQSEKPVSRRSPLAIFGDKGRLIHNKHGMFRRYKINLDALPDLKVKMWAPTTPAITT
jgi:hypothetical protein